jgi:ribosomal protein L40E
MPSDSPRQRVSQKTTLPAVSHLISYRPKICSPCGARSVWRRLRRCHDHPLSHQNEVSRLQVTFRAPYGDEPKSPVNLL